MVYEIDLRGCSWVKWSSYYIYKVVHMVTYMSGGKPLEYKISYTEVVIDLFWNKSRTEFFCRSIYDAANQNTGGKYFGGQHGG